MNPLDLIYAALGLVILLFAGDALVRGAVNLSLRLGVPALIVSLTIVAFGTSAPELLISIKAVLERAPGIALGNVVGSNTANILLVLGVPAIISRLHTSGHDTSRTYLFMISGSILFIALAFWAPLTWIHGSVLLVALTAMIGDQIYEAHVHRKDNAARRDAEEIEIEGLDPALSGWLIALFLALGLIGLPLGADLLVDSAVNIAEALGVSDTVIGLTLIAIGTSLPELATTVMAAVRRQADVAIGNVIGSNMFNLLAIVGIATFFGRIPVDPSFLRFDLWVMLGASILLAPFVFLERDMTRRIGFTLTALYILYLYLVIS